MRTSVTLLAGGNGDIRDIVWPSLYVSGGALLDRQLVECGPASEVLMAAWGARTRVPVV